MEESLWSRGIYLQRASFGASKAPREQNCDVLPIPRLITGRSSAWGLYDWFQCSWALALTISSVGHLL